MKTSSSRGVVGDRQRCTACGHPNREHHGSEGCTVPQCPCREYAAPAARKSSGSSS